MFYLYNETEAVGPFSAEQLEAKLQNGEVQSGDLVRFKGAHGLTWKSVSEVLAAYRSESGFAIASEEREVAASNARHLKEVEAEKDDSGLPGHTPVGKKLSEALSNIRALRDTCMGMLKYQERHFETGVPPEVLATRLYVGLLAESRFDWVECEGRIEFWQSPNPLLEEEHAAVCAVFIEQAGNRLKVTFGSLGFIGQTLRAAVRSRRDSMKGAVATAVLLGPGMGVAAGLASTAIGASFGMVNVLLERTVWSETTAILQMLGRQYPQNPDAKPVEGGSVLDRLEQLVRLRDAGALDPEEFGRLKGDLMAQPSEALSKKEASQTYSQEMKLIRLAPSLEQIQHKSREERGLTGSESGCLVAPFRMLRSCIFLGALVFPPLMILTGSHGGDSPGALEILLFWVLALVFVIAFWRKWKKDYPAGKLIEFVGLD